MRLTGAEMTERGSGAVRYRNGRSSSWLKLKCVYEQEFVVGGFTEWTGDGKLRHPRYTGLRQDKSSEKVSKEQR